VSASGSAPIVVPPLKITLVFDYMEPLYDHAAPIMATIGLCAKEIPGVDPDPEEMDCIFVAENEVRNSPRKSRTIFLEATFEEFTIERNKLPNTEGPITIVASGYSIPRYPHDGLYKCQYSEKMSEALEVLEFSICCFDYNYIDIITEKDERISEYCK
jgi:hypothetical protein